MELFLESRAVEVVVGGLMAFLIPGVPASWDPQTEYTIPSDINLLGSCLMDMAKKVISHTIVWFKCHVDRMNLYFQFSID